MNFVAKAGGIFILGAISIIVVPWSASGEDAKTKVGSLVSAQANLNPSMNPAQEVKRQYQILAQQQPSQPSPDQPVNVPPGPPGSDTLPCKADPEKNPKCGEVNTKTKPTDKG